MRARWLTIRISLLFTALMGLVLAGTLFLFIRVFGLHTGHGPGRCLHDLVRVAEELEELLASSPEEPLDSPQVRQLIAERASELGVGLQLIDGAGEPLTPGSGETATDRQLLHSIHLHGRVCEWMGPLAQEIRIPIRSAGRQVGSLVATVPIRVREAHAAFKAGLLWVGGVTLFVVIAISLYLTRPLHRMSSSMDRIAAGDLSHRVRIQGQGEVEEIGRSFNTMADRIEHMVVGQKELLAGVSHELRSPLARMKMLLELLRGEGADRQRLADLEVEVDTIDELVEEVLVVSRLDLGESPLRLEVLQLEELARDAWDRVDVAATDCAMQLQLEVDDAARCVRGDHQLLLRALGNLFENAVRYAAAGNVLVSAQHHGDRVRITVADEGPGVAEQHLPRLFEPFFRADPSRSRRTGATGLGLMIVRRSIEAHGGTVSAGRADNGGLLISFDLPTLG